MTVLKGRVLKERDPAFGQSRLILLLLAAPGSMWLGWAGMWLYAPLPIAAAFVFIEIAAWWISERPTELSLGDELTVTIPSFAKSWTLRPEEILSLTVLQRHQGPVVERFFVMGTATGPAVVWSAEVDGAPRPGELDLVALDLVVGRLAGLLGDLSSEDRFTRHFLPDQAHQIPDWFAGRVSDEARETRRIRLWRGREVSRNLFGSPSGPHQGLLVLRGRTWRLEVPGDAPQSGVLEVEASAMRVRTLLLAGPGAGKSPDGLDLLVLSLAGGPRLSLPSTMLPESPEVPTGDLPEWHANSGEGLIVVWHLLEQLDPQAWPPILRELVLQAALAEPDLPELLLRGLPSDPPSDPPGPT